MHATITAASSAILAVVLVQLLEHKNNVDDFEYHAMIKTVMLDFNSSYRRSLKEYYHEVGTDFNSIKNEVNKRYSSLHIDFKKFSENYNKCQNETMKMWDFKIKCETELKNIQTDFQKFGNETLLKMDKIRKVDVNENECNKDVQWYSMFFLGVGEVVVTIFLVRVVRTLNALMRLPGNEVLSKRSTDGGRRQFNSDKKWKDTGNLRRSIAIICFNDTRIAFYRDLMGDITSGMVTEYHRVSRKADVTQIKSMAAVLFVERNDRHIILESEHEIGDLKVSCVRYIQQNGGHVIVVYCGHKQSESMGDLLCSPNLMSADRHRELRALKDESCFLSINETFSEVQKNHLKTKLKEYLDRK